MSEPPSRGQCLVDVLITIARSEYPHEWSRYCDVAQKLAQTINKKALEFSAEDCAQRRLIGQDQNPHGLIADFYSQLAGGAPSQLQKMTWEATPLERMFRDRLISVLHSGAYSLTGYNPDLRLVTIPIELISLELLRFDRDEIQLGDTIIRGVRAAFTSLQISASEGLGRKPGYETAKRRANDAARSILDNDAERPLKRQGRMVQLARMVQEIIASEGIRYKVNSIEKMIRPIVKEWEEHNPDK